MTLSLVSYPNPHLRRPAIPVPPEAFGTRLLAEQAADMMQACEHYKGLGLAAQQVGLDLSMAIIPRKVKEKQEPIFVANLRIESSMGRLKNDEACLSFQGHMAPCVWAPAEVKWVAQDLAGDTIQGTARDYAARAVWHEALHLNGHLLIDRVKPPWRKIWLRQMGVSYGG